MPDQICAACNTPRKAVSLELLNERYQIVLHECPSCKSVLRLVEHRKVIPDFGKRTTDRPKRDD
jgi:hypothetical protein